MGALLCTRALFFFFSLNMDSAGSREWGNPTFIFPTLYRKASLPLSLNSLKRSRFHSASRAPAESHLRSLEVVQRIRAMDAAAAVIFSRFFCAFIFSGFFAHAIILVRNKDYQKPTYWHLLIVTRFQQGSCKFVHEVEFRMGDIDFILFSVFSSWIFLPGYFFLLFTLR